MKLLVSTLFYCMYNVLWFCLGPLLMLLCPKLRRGAKQRLLLDRPLECDYDLWIQSASGGESKLACLLVKEIHNQHGFSKKILLTSGTQQGVETLSELLDKYHDFVDIRYFPFDAPYLMGRAFRYFNPKVAVIIETELWPGYLLAAKQHGCQTILINGRLSESSCSSYKRFKTVLDSIGPRHIMAMSDGDENRFKQIFDVSRVSRMNNIKFLSLMEKDGAKDDNLQGILKEPLIVLGSIRRQEEDDIISVIQELHRAKPNCQIAIFPKHIERAGQLKEKLQGKGFSVQLRSELKSVVDVIVWDTFGELSAVYGYASATFVGGSLQDLGGHNFLEPLSHGLRPIIGPFWSDFYWVGKEIFKLGYVLQVTSKDELVLALLTELDRKYDKMTQIGLVRDYFKDRQDGCVAVVNKIDELLENNMDASYTKK